MSNSSQLPPEKQDKSTLYVVLCTLAMGILVVFYMSVLSRVNETQSKEDPLDKTAKIVARDISLLSREHSSFGKLRISDFNELKGALRCAYLFAQSTGQTNSIEKLLKSDLDELKDTEHNFATTLQNSVSENGMMHTLAVKTLNNSLPRTSRLFSLKISLGSGKEKDPAVSNIVVPDSDKQDPLCTFVQKGFYKSNFPVDIFDRQIIFQKHYDKCEIFEPEQFIFVTPDTIPSTLMMEAVIEQTDNTEAKRHIIIRTCATIGSVQTKKTPLCFSFRFPHGLPESLKPIDFLNDSLWSNSGEWYQAAKGDVPGRGQLGPAVNPVISIQKPSQALTVALYHWIRHCHSTRNIDPNKLKALLNQKIQSSNLQLKAKVNSCLLSDRFHNHFDALKVEHRRGLYDCFEYQENPLELPPDAFPLIVDREGKINIAGRSLYDSLLIKDYLNSLYKTNIAALETLEISKLVLGNTSARIAKLKMEIRSKQEELKALSLKINTDQKSNQAENILSAIEQDKKMLDELLALKNISKLTARNAQIAILRTYELGSHNLNYCRNGLHKLDNNPKRFLLSRKDVFHSYENPISDQKIIEASKGKPVSGSDGGGWLNEKFTVLESWQNLNAQNDTIDRKPVDMVLAEEENISGLAPFEVLLDGVQMHISYASPSVYAGLPVCEGQLFYYATDSLRQNKLNWSVALRDQVCQSKIQPPSARSPAQFLKADFQPALNLEQDHYPLMAGEFQLRRPIVKDLPELKGIVLRDPSWKKESPIIPPVPPNML